MKKNIVQCLILISALAVLLTAVLSAVGFYNVYEEQVQKQLRTQAQVVRDSLEFTEDPLGYLEATKKAAGDIRFTLIDQGGTVLFDSSADVAGMENHENRAEVIRARESGFGEATRQSETLGQKTYYAAVRCEDGSVLRAAVALQSVSAVFVNNLPMTLGIVLLMVLVSVPVSRLMTRRLLAPIMDAAASYEAKRDGAALVGINMEGPYISPGNIGAQNPAYLHLPDEAMFRRLQERSGNLIKLVDVAPEVDGALDFIRSVSSDVRVSIAHTQADYDTACAAIEAGARQMTHLCNAMPPLHHRKPGPIGAAFDHSEVMPELIADGVHIHPSMVRLLFAAFGADRVILISDSMMATGLDDGEYSLGGQDVTVRGNVATLRSGTIAGSATDLMACVRVAVRDMGIPLDAAVRAASANPARALGLEGERGSIEVGKIADAVVLDENLRVRHVILRGELLG